MMKRCLQTVVPDGGRDDTTFYFPLAEALDGELSEAIDWAVLWAIKKRLGYDMDPQFFATQHFIHQQSQGTVMRNLRGPLMEKLIPVFPDDAMSAPLRTICQRDLGDVLWDTLAFPLNERVLLEDTQERDAPDA